MQDRQHLTQHVISDRVVLTASPSKYEPSTDPQTQEAQHVELVLRSQETGKSHPVFAGVVR